MTTALADALVLLVPANEIDKVKKGGRSDVYYQKLNELLDAVSRGLPTPAQLGASTPSVSPAGNEIHAQVKLCNTERLKMIEKRYDAGKSKFLGHGIYGLGIKVSVGGEERVVKLFQTSAYQTFYTALREQEIAHFLSNRYATSDALYRPVSPIYDWWRVVASLDPLGKKLGFSDTGTLMDGYSKMIGATAKEQEQAEATDRSLTGRKPVQWFAMEMEFIDLDLAEYMKQDHTPAISNTFVKLLGAVFIIAAQLSEAGIAHMDFHNGNVRLRRLAKASTVSYELNDKIYSFELTHIPVVVDFGRSYVKELSNSDTDDLEAEIIMVESNGGFADVEPAALRGPNFGYDARRMAFSILKTVAKFSRYTSSQNSLVYKDQWLTGPAGAMLRTVLAGVTIGRTTKLYDDTKLTVVSVSKLEPGVIPITGSITIQDVLTAGGFKPASGKPKNVISF